MSDIGKLCYKKGGTALAYKKSGSALIYKTNKAGDIYLMIVADQSQVGPIHTRGNVHDVLIHPDGSFSDGSGTFTTTESSAGQAACTIHISTKPATVDVSCTTESRGCAYPNENPPMNFSISASQDSGDPKTTSKNVSNVAKGSFSFTVTVDSSGRLSGVN